MIDSTNAVPTGGKIRPSPAAIAEQIRRRKRRFFRGAAFMLAMTLGLCVLIVARNDRAVRDWVLTETRAYATALEAYVDKAHILPVYLPRLSEFRMVYCADDAVRVMSLYHDRTFVVAYSPRVPQYFSSDGRAIIEYSQGRCRVRWVSQQEFERLLEAQQAWIRQEQERARAESIRLPD